MMTNFSFGVPNTTASAAGIELDNVADQVPSRGFISTEDKLLAENVMEVGIALAFAIFGIVGNVMSIIVFAKLGFKDTINISMTFICTWDVVRCVLAVFRKLYGVIRPFDPVLALSWSGVSYMTVGYVSLAAIYTSGVLAGYVAVERCLCVSMPLAVRFLLTPRVVFINNFLISILVMGSFMIIYPCITFVSIFIPRLNTTVLTWSYTPFFYENQGIDVFVNVIGIFWLLLSFIVICFCTAIIASKLKRAMKFKAQHSNAQKGSGSKGISDRDKQVIKLLLVMLVAYICVGLPRILIFLCRWIFYEFSHFGREVNLFHVTMYVASVVDFFNCDVNIVVFYVMSTHFKKKFRATFCKSSEKKDNAMNMTCATTVTAAH